MEGKQSGLIALCLIFFPLYKVYISAPNLVKTVKKGISEQRFLGYREGCAKVQSSSTGASIYFHVNDFCRLDGADETRLSLYIAHLAAGYPLNHGFIYGLPFWTHLIGPVLLLLLLSVMVACTALVKSGIAQVSILGSLKAESKEQTILKFLFKSNK